MTVSQLMATLGKFPFQAEVFVASNNAPDAIIRDAMPCEYVREGVFIEIDYPGSNKYNVIRDTSNIPKAAVPGVLIV